MLANGVQGGYDYREIIVSKFREILLLQPDPALIADSPLSYQMHTLAGMALFAL